MKKRILVLTFLFLSFSVVAEAVDLSAVDWKPWPTAANHKRPPLSSRFMQVDAPPGTITSVTRWANGRNIIVTGKNSRTMPAIADVVSETAQYWTVNPRRLNKCGNPICGKCFNVYKPKVGCKVVVDNRKPATTTTVTTTTTATTTNVYQKGPRFSFSETSRIPHERGEWRIKGEDTFTYGLMGQADQNVTVKNFNKVIVKPCPPPKPPPGPKPCPTPGPGPGGGPTKPPAPGRTR